MKSTKLLLAITLFAGLATISIAGPGPQFWNRTKPVTSAKDTAAVQPADAGMKACSACQTTALTEFKSEQSNGRPPQRLVNVGSKHECSHCGGAITTINGKTTDTMGRNCKMCGEGTDFCCAVTPGTAVTKS